MRATVEISMYPLRDDFLPPIDAFIAALQEPGLTVTVGPTSTVIVGDYDMVLALLRRAIAASHEVYGKAVFVTKIIPGYPEGDAA
jgi:uncharacterized protein YqgV (UPF0045/DUF77 family)